MDPARDRPVQFAGVRAHADFNVIGGPLNSVARPTPDTLPHPISALLTGITPQQALEQGLAGCEFIARLLAERAQPGTCGARYSSRRKDELPKEKSTSKGMTPILHTSGRYGSDHRNTRLVVPVAAHPTKRNSIIVFDPAQDSALLLVGSAATMDGIGYPNRDGTPAYAGGTRTENAQNLQSSKLSNYYPMIIDFS